MSAAPLRVLLACDRLDVAGGVERFTCTLANHLAGQGLAVTVATVATPRSALRYPLDARVALLQGDAPLPDGDGALALLRRQWRTGVVLLGLARRAGPDVVLLNGLTTAASVLLLDRLTAPLRGGALAPRCICCDHNHFGARSRPWQRLRAWLYPRVAAVVSLTQADAPRFAALNPRTEVIANASALQAAPGALPARTGELVLAVGRAVAQKGLDLLLQAWPAVAAARPAARLRIVGDGPLLPALQAQARALGIDGQVQWVAPTPQIAAHYAEAALFVLPSRYEGMPLALLEAQALGLPAVAFDCPTGPAEIVAPDTGRVVPAGDVPALAAALVELLADAPRRARMADAARARSQALFSPALHFARWTALVQRVGAAHG